MNQCIPIAFSVTFQFWVGFLLPIAIIATAERFLANMISIHFPHDTESCNSHQAFRLPARSPGCLSPRQSWVLPCLRREESSHGRTGSCPLQLCFWEQLRCHHCSPWSAGLRPHNAASHCPCSHWRSLWKEKKQWNRVSRLGSLMLEMLANILAWMNECTASPQASLYPDPRHLSQSDLDYANGVHTTKTQP